MTDEARPSKTQRKKEVHALQALGEALVTLGEEELAALELPERLRDAVMAARRIRGFEARRRQLQYIGKLMRSVDPAPIRAALDASAARSRGDTVTHQRTEAWRTRLLAEPGALGELLTAYPDADAQQLHALVRSAEHEREAGQPPRAFRQLYQALRALLEKRDS